jgi:hypothetical protein
VDSTVLSLVASHYNTYFYILQIRQLSLHYKQMKEKKESSSQVKPRPVLALTLGALFIGVIWLVIWLLLFRNYAQEVAQPLEGALISAGASKVCQGGDPGRGPDAIAPGYVALFKTKASVEDVQKQLTGGVSGLTFKATVGTYEDVNLRATKEKGDAYSDLQSGEINYMVTIYESVGVDPRSSYCGTIDRNITSDETIFTLTVNMPQFKR